MPPAAPPRLFKRLTSKETTEHHRAGLCFNCDEPFTGSHKCKHLFNIRATNDYNVDDVDNSLLMMLGTTPPAVHGCHPMYLAGAILGTGVHILVDTGATHNIIDINVARTIGLLEQRITTTILVGSGHKISCRAGAFSMPLRINAESF